MNQIKTKAAHGDLYKVTKRSDDLGQDIEYLVYYEYHPPKKAPQKGCEPPEEPDFFGSVEINATIVGIGEEIVNFYPDDVWIENMADEILENRNV